MGVSIVQRSSEREIRGRRLTIWIQFGWSSRLSYITPVMLNLRMVARGADEVLRYWRSSLLLAARSSSE